MQPGIDKIAAEAWRACERSQQPQIEQAKEQTSSGEDVTTKQSKRIRHISGEQSYLGIAIKCVAMRKKLFAMIQSDGSSDDVVINSVEVVVHNRDEAIQMLENLNDCPFCCSASLTVGSFRFYINGIKSLMESMCFCWTMNDDRLLPKQSLNHEQ